MKVCFQSGLWSVFNPLIGKHGNGKCRIYRWLFPLKHPLMILTMDNTSFIDIYSGFPQSNTLKAPWFLVRFPNLAAWHCRPDILSVVVGAESLACHPEWGNMYIYIYYVYIYIYCDFMYSEIILRHGDYIYIHMHVFKYWHIYIYIWCSWKYALHTLGCVQNLKGEELFTPASRPLNSARQHKDGGIGEFGEFPGIAPGENPKCW